MTSLRIAFALLLFLPASLAACADGPREHVVNARFACDDGRDLRVAFHLDAKTAALRIGRKETALLASDNPTGGRAYSGAGYALKGIGDRVTLTTPTTPATACLETR